MTFDIIGAGIGGLTLAVALQRKGIEARVFEQAKEIKAVGAGIILANNAMQVYEKLGLRSELENNGNFISSMNVTKPNLNPISKIDLKYFEDKYQVKNVAIHRGKLQQILVEQLPSSQVYLDYKFEKADQANITFENSKTIQSEAIIGADGLNSTVRSTTFFGRKNQECSSSLLERSDKL